MLLEINGYTFGAKNASLRIVTYVNCFVNDWCAVNSMAFSLIMCVRIILNLWYSKFIVIIGFQSCLVLIGKKPTQSVSIKLYYLNTAKQQFWVAISRERKRLTEIDESCPVLRWYLDECCKTADNPDMPWNRWSFSKPHPLFAHPLKRRLNYGFLLKNITCIFLRA